MTETRPREPYAGYSARRISEILILLSLDSQAPFFPLVAVNNVPDKGTFQQSIRRIIIDYRAIDEQMRPELLPFAGQRIALELGTERQQQFEYWVHNVFVFSSVDYSAYSAWTGFLFDLFKLRLVIDENFGLPSRLGREAAAKALKDLSLADFHKVQDEHDDDALSEWDADMYARHGLFSEQRDPSIPMKLTFKQLRFRRYVSWLIDMLNAKELADFESKARSTANGTGTPNGVPVNLPHLPTQALPDADVHLRAI